MAETYRLKTINFLGRRVPIVVQNENGPCPMLALANVMLLRNQIHLSPDAPEVTQERLLSLIAGHLLDVNAKGGISEEQAANMTRIIADAVELLPKLTTGIDVNVIFKDIRGFEYTDAIAIFDLLDIQLVHGWLVDPQDPETAAAIGRKSYNALMERMVALTGRASLPTAASQDNQQPDAAAKTTVPSTPEELVSAINTEAAVKASESSSGLPPQHTSTALRSEGGDSAAPSAASNADAGCAARSVMDSDSAANLDSAPAAGSAAASELPEAASKLIAADQTIEKGVPVGGTSASHPTDTRGPLSEADELDLALKLSLNGAEQGSAAPSVSTAAWNSKNKEQPPAAGPQSSAKGLPQSSESLPEHPAAPAGVPSASLPEPAEGRHFADELDHDFVVVDPEEAPGVGFEQVDMPKMGSESASGSQELTSAPAPPTAGCSQQVAEPHKEIADAPAEACIQHDRADACSPDDSLEGAAVVPEEPTCAAPEHSTAHTSPSKAEQEPDISPEEAKLVSEEPTRAAAEHSIANAGPSRAERPPQPAPALDERAVALLGALPKPGHAEGHSAPPADPQAASVPQQLPASGSPVVVEEAAASREPQKALGDASGQEPGQPGTVAASRAQIARMGSTKEAYLIQSFLDNASSQLTKHGLVSLNEGLKPRQLAILFRNNHFNTLFKFEDALYLLVTDQGYLHEQEVVWEKLDAIDGNTKYVGSQIYPPDPAAADSAGDLQLAMQLQQQEDEEHQQRMAAQRQQPGQQPGQAPAQAAQAGPLGVPHTSSRGPRHGPGQSHGHHRRGRGAYRSQRPGQAAHAAGRGSSRDCTMM